MELLDCAGNPLQGNWRLTVPNSNYVYEYSHDPDDDASMRAYVGWVAFSMAFLAMFMLA